jgi:ATP-dependent Clp protease adapter protein ClpS
VRHHSYVAAGWLLRLLTHCLSHHSNATAGKKPPIYKVLLHNDNFNRREYVVKVLLKVVDGLGVDDAVNVMQVRGSRHT